MVKSMEFRNYHFELRGCLDGVTLLLITFSHLFPIPTGVTERDCLMRFCAINLKYDSMNGVYVWVIREDL